MSLMQHDYVKNISAGAIIVTLVTPAIGIATYLIVQIVGEIKIITTWSPAFFSFSPASPFSCRRKTTRSFIYASVIFTHWNLQV